MINFTLLPSHYLRVGRGSVCPLNGSLYYVCWVWGECWAGLGGSLQLDTWTSVCLCVQSCVCEGLEVFPACVLCGHTVMLIPVNEHMAASKEMRRLREREGGGGSAGTSVLSSPTCSYSWPWCTFSTKPQARETQSAPRLGHPF